MKVRRVVHVHLDDQDVSIIRDAYGTLPLQAAVQSIVDGYIAHELDDGWMEPAREMLDGTAEDRDAGA